MKSDLNNQNVSASTSTPEAYVAPQAESALRQLARIILAIYQHPDRLPESNGTVSLCTPEK